MPELPEVETIRRSLARKVIDKKIKRVVIRKKRLVKNTPTVFKRELIGKKFKCIE